MVDVAENNIAIRTRAELFTDPGMTTIFGFIVLLLGIVLIMIKPEIKDLYMPFSLGVVGLVSGHAFSDANKTKYVNENKTDH